MKLALFNDHRLGVVRGDTIVDVTSALPAWDNGYMANFWLRMCHDFDALRPKLEQAAASGQGMPVSQARLNPPVLNPTKILAAASNYAAHKAEMNVRRDFTGDAKWLGEFDVFLKAPSSIIGPDATVYLPEVGDREIHHESELAFVIGKSAKDVPPERAMEHVLGYTILLDITVRGEGDRSRRKSYDGFTPIGPYLVTADEVGDPNNLHIQLWVNGQTRQDVNSSDLLVKIPDMISYASKVYTLNPGDVFTTGSPPGVGQIHDGDTMVTEIAKIGRMTNHVKARAVAPAGR
ncbi:MAG TPA: fumarylacetoacetate hydrolase family protein [Chloroflexota bacterium]|jgi:2-keto-4-pentenoate hydratase/2-oxohepta-3-ene-1,7-dioic acid hydratase in catechol pathway